MTGRVAPALDALVAALAAHPLPGDLGELVRRRVATLVGADADALPPLGPADPDRVRHLPHWPTDDRFDDRDRAALDFAESWVIDPHRITDDQRARLLAELTEPEAVTLTMVLAVHEALARASVVRAAVHHEEIPT